VTPNWFIGLPLSGAHWFAEAISDAPPSVRTFHPEDLHMTIAFLGDCGAEAALASWKTLALPHDAQSLTIGLAGIEPLGNPQRPSALSVVLKEGKTAAVTLIAILREPLQRAAAAPLDQRPPLPHITVARPARNADAAQRRAALNWAKTKPAIDFSLTLTHIALYTWTKQRTVRQFRIVKERLLQNDRQ
jgi:2'-5' RNA ligase